MKIQQVTSSIATLVFSALPMVSEAQSRSSVFRFAPQSEADVAAMQMLISEGEVVHAQDDLYVYSSDSAPSSVQPSHAVEESERATLLENLRRQAEPDYYQEVLKRKKFLKYQLSAMSFSTGA